MAKTTVDVDPVKASRAQALLGTETLRATIDAALEHVIAEAARREFIQLGAEGAFADLLDPSVEQRMWA